MPALTCKVISGKGFHDISPPAGCCGKRVPSQPLCFFTIPSADMTWTTAASMLSGDGVAWNKEFTTIQCREPESDQLHMVVVDGAHWKPALRGKQNMELVPLKHYYGEVRMSVIQFERMKKEVQELTLKARNGSDTGYMIKVEGFFQDDNIDDHRIGIHQLSGPPGQNFGAAGGPPANTYAPSQQAPAASYPQAAPAAGYQPGPPAAGPPQASNPYDTNPYASGGNAPYPPQPPTYGGYDARSGEPAV
eukprot:Hpha_TRINITY_DN13204_c0_g1::TRINITY_DN13204_c0_g1_i1::g.154685::m.154685